jgi:hypothetical protein
MRHERLRRPAQNCWNFFDRQLKPPLIDNQNESCERKEGKLRPAGLRVTIDPYRQGQTPPRSMVRPPIGTELPLIDSLR